MFAGCAINGGFDGGAEAVEQQKVAIVEIVGEAHQAVNRRGVPTPIGALSC
jgi:hypothetical protein